MLDLGLAGRTALIFGGSKGLGRGTAEAFAGEGVRLALIARDPRKLHAAGEAIASQYGVHVATFAADLADIEATLDAVERASTVLGGAIDILLNNTGGPPPGPVSGAGAALWEEQFHSMVLSVIRITNRVLPDMRRAGWGRILTIASSVVVEPSPLLGISSTLRSALVGWSKTLASEVAQDGVTVNVLLPGRIATDRTLFLDERAAAASGVTPEEICAERAAEIPVGRYGTPAEFGAVAAFLASRHASYITGARIRVDGGVLRSV